MLCNQFSTASGSDCRIFYLLTPRISSNKSFKFSSVRLPSRSSSSKLKVECVVDPPCSCNPDDDDHLSFYQLHDVPETGTLPDIKKPYHGHEMAELKKEWRAQWQAQIEELKNKTTNNKYGDRSHLSRARNESLNEF